MTNNNISILFAVLLRHIIDLLLVKLNIVPNAKMESVAHKCVFDLFKDAQKMYDFDFRKFVNTDRIITRHVQLLKGRLENVSIRLIDDMVMITELTFNLVLLIWYIPSSKFVLMIVIYVLYTNFNKITENRFKHDSTEEMQYLNTKFISELYHNPKTIDQFLDKSAKNKYNFIFAWGSFNYNAMLQRIWFDIAIIIHVLYCIIYSYINNTNNKIIAVICTGLLRSISRLRTVSKLYLGLYHDYTILINNLKELSTTKTEQISIPDSIIIEKQIIELDNIVLNVNPIKLKNVGSVLVTGDSGQGKTIFLHMISGFLSSGIKIVYKDSIKQMASLRDLCCFYTKSFDTYKNVSVKEYLTKFGIINCDDDSLIKYLQIAALEVPLKFLHNKLSNLSEGQVQRVIVASIIAEIENNTDKRIIILDEATSALDGSASKKLITNLITRYKDTHLLFIVSHSETVQALCDFEFILNANNMTITQIK